MSWTTTIKTQENKTMSVYNIKINDLDGNPINLEKFKGKYLLFVNVASKCGFTKQYADLQELYDLFIDNIMVIGVPCNQFGAQEPGSPDEIQTFCKKNYGVTFLMTEKISVKGNNQHPLYNWLTDKSLNGVKNSTVKWNFQKYIVDRDGNLIDYFYSMTRPLSSKITKIIK
jgi:glutathione peroxidase